jgi:hypothetical protein
MRWSRLENLFEEGSKSQDYDPAQVGASTCGVCGGALQGQGRFCLLCSGRCAMLQACINGPADSALSPMFVLQLWLLAEWVCSEGGRPVRKPLAKELVRLVDATITHSVR